MAAGRLNNKLINAFAVLVSEGSLHGAVGNLKDGGVEVRPSAPTPSGNLSSLVSAVESYIRGNGIGDIDSYVIIPPGMMTADDMRMFSKLLRMKLRDVLVMDAVDVLAYGCWNHLGHDIGERGARTSKRTWACGSRLALVMIDGNRAALSMVNSGHLITRLSFPDGMFSPLDASAGCAGQVIYEAMLSRMHKWVGEVFSPNRILYYFTADAPKTTYFTSSHDVLQSGDLLHDLTRSVMALDISKAGVPEFILSARGDYDDLVLNLRDEDGNEREYPIFDHA